MIIQICVGSSCHLKGTEEIVELCKNAIEKNVTVHGILGFYSEIGLPLTGENL